MLHKTADEKQDEKPVKQIAVASMLREVQEHRLTIIMMMTSR